MKIVSAGEAAIWVRDWREMHKSIVFTNGCFNLLHIGHVVFLEQAKAMGDKLIVAVNSSASLKRLKASEYIVPEAERCAMLAALECVDAVVTFHGERSLLDLIARIAPDILVKGSEYRGQDVPGCRIIKDVRFAERRVNVTTSKRLMEIGNAMRHARANRPGHARSG